MVINRFITLIAGDRYMKPGLIQQIIEEYLEDKLSKSLIFKTVEFPYPEEEISLTPETVVPSGMSWSNFLQFKKIDGISEYYGFPHALEEYIDDVQILVIHGAALPEFVLQKGKKLKLICSLRGGPKNIDIVAAKKMGIKIAYTPGKNARAVAESTLGGLLTLTRNITQSSWLLQREKIWKPVFFNYDICGIEIKDKVFGIIGFGHIAKEVVELLRGFKLKKILVFDPYKPNDEMKKSGVVPTDLKQLLRESDIISLHARLAPSSRVILGKEEFASMLRKPIIINTARGTLVDYEALIQALKNEKVSGAVLDVFPDGPFRKYRKLLEMPNVVCTPHIAGGSKETVMRAAKMVAEEIKRFILGLPLRNEI